MSQKFKVKTRRQIALEYGFSARTLNNKLKEKNITLPSGLLTVKSQRIIYEAIGYPNLKISLLFEQEAE